MMKRWSVEVIKSERSEAPIEVEAEDWSGAREAAFKLFEGQPQKPGEVYFSSREVVQLGEPWAYSRGWYDFHGPDNIIVIKRATGNRFSAEDINLLHRRLWDLGFPVHDC